MGLSLNNLVRTRWFRTFMAKLYGWGASVVILGALFKINHYAGADIMLIIGLGTEAVIFFFSGFEPPYVEPDWSLVYPELAGMYHKGGEGGGRPVDELDDMLKEANIDRMLITSLGDGMRNLSDRASKLAEVTDAASATSDYVKNVKSASESAGELSTAYQSTSESLKQDANASEEYNTNIRAAASGANVLSESYKKANETLQNDVSATKDFTESIRTAMGSANTLADEYSKSAKVLAESAEKLDFSSVDGSEYNAQLDQISKNLAALNSVYELQMQSSNEQIESTTQVRETMNELLNQMKESVTMMSAYKDQMGTLTNRLSALNNVYGGMLSAMNVGNK